MAESVVSTFKFADLCAANSARGEAQAFVHIAGYSFGLGFTKIKWLLKDEHWRQCGFHSLEAFADSIQFDKSMKAAAEQRKELVALFKKADEGKPLSNRRIAKALNVDEITIRRDGATNVAPALPSGGRAAEIIAAKLTATADRLEKVAADEERVLALAPVIGKFRTLILDPAWDYDWLSLAGRAKPGYAMQTHEELLALDVKAWADQEAGYHLYLWTTNNFLARACELMAHWGFQHRTVITWIKKGAFGLGSYFRNSTEHVLFGTLGDTTTRHAAASIPTHFVAPRGEHSEKPEAFYEIVRAASYPPFGEANQREPRDDFVNLFQVADVPPKELHMFGETL